MPSARVAIVAVGNVLMGDDGAGVRVIERLQQQALPEGVELFDAGTAVQDVLPGLEGYDRIIVVDAMRAGGEPGDLYAFDLDAEALGSDGPSLSAHDINLVAALRLQLITGRPVPPIRVLGVEPGDVSLKLELSDEVRARVSELADRALQEAGAGRACAQPGGRT